MKKSKHCLLLTSTVFSFLHPETGFNAIKTQPSDNKIVTAGFQDIENNRTFLVNRYNTDGTLDITFNGEGFITTPIGLFSTAHDVAIRTSDERIIVGGYSFTGATVAALTRYLSTGPLDQSFGSDGIVTTVIGQGAQINALAIQTDNKVVVCGSTIVSGAPEIFLARYNTDGTLDNTFGTGGIVNTTIGTRSGATSLVIQPSDGRIVIAAFVDYDSFAIARYNTNGTLDNTFGTNGITQTVLGNLSQPLSIALQANGKFVLAGQSLNHITLVRYNSDGSLDTNFGVSGIVTTQINQDSLAHSVKINPDNSSIIIGGASDDRIVNVKYTSTGALDPNFGKDGIVILDLEKAAHAKSIAIHPSTTGVINAGDRSSKGIITQLSPTGTLDCTFNDNGIVLFPSNPTTEPSYAFAASTSTQNLGTTFANITFDISGPSKNWSHSPGGSVFKCLRSGSYLITYSGIYSATALIALSSMSLITLRNGVEISGSQISVNLSVGIGSINVTRNMIVTVCENDEIRFQHRRSSGVGTISLQALGFGTTPIGATVTINRIS